MSLQRQLMFFRSLKATKMQMEILSVADLKQCFQVMTRALGCLETRFHLMHNRKTAAGRAPTRKPHTPCGKSHLPWTCQASGAKCHRCEKMNHCSLVCTASTMERWNSGQAWLWSAGLPGCNHSWGASSCNYHRAMALHSNNTEVFIWLKDTVVRQMFSQLMCE